MPYQFATPSIVFALLVTMSGLLAATPMQARELPLETFGMISHGMSEAEVMSRTGQPDQRVDQWQPTQLNQTLISYQYIWVGESGKNEWTTTITFSAKTNKVIDLSRERR